MKTIIAFPPCTTGLNGAHEWNETRTQCEICEYIPPYPALVKNRGHRRAAECRKDLIKRDGPLCRYCGTDVKITIEHLVPRSRGGRAHRFNLGLACVTCNDLKGNLTDDEFVIWILTGTVPLGPEFVAIHHRFAHTKGKRKPLRQKYIRRHPDAGEEIT